MIRTFWRWECPHGCGSVHYEHEARRHLTHHATKHASKCNSTKETRHVDPHTLNIEKREVPA